MVNEACHDRGSNVDSSADRTANRESAVALRSVGAGGLVWFLTSHPQRQVHEVKNQTRMEWVGRGGEERKKKIIR